MQIANNVFAFAQIVWFVPNFQFFIVWRIRNQDLYPILWIGGLRIAKHANSLTKNELQSKVFHDVSTIAIVVTTNPAQVIPYQEINGVFFHCVTSFREFIPGFVHDASDSFVDFEPDFPSFVIVAIPFRIHDGQELAHFFQTPINDQFRLSKSA